MKIRILILLWLLPYLAVSQSYMFLHVGIKDGLSNTAINDIYQDEFGMMWFATRGGLDRYDGNSVKVYHPYLVGSLALPALSMIDAIHGDNQGFLFLRTHGKLIAFDLKNESFFPISNKDVSASGNGQSGIWFAVNNELYVLNKEDHSIKHYFTLNNIDKISSIFEDTKGVCWISTSSQEFFSLDKNKTLKRYFSNNAVRKVLEDSKGNLWIISNKGLIKYGSNGEQKHYKHNPDDLQSLVHDNIRAACFDENGSLWIGSEFGLCRMDMFTEKFETINTVFGHEFGLNSKSVMCLFSDKQGTVWVGSFFKGINYLNINKQPFKFYYERNEMPFPVVGKFAEDKRGRIWICTEGGGLCSLDSETGIFESYDEEKHGLIDLNYKAIHYDESNENLWLLGTTSRISCFNVITKKTIIYEYPEKPFKDILDFIPYDDKFLLATRTGLKIFNPKANKIEKFLPEYSDLDVGMTSLLIDSNKRLWMTTLTEGIMIYNFKDETITSFKYIPDAHGQLVLNEANVVFEDSQQRIWIGTKGLGLRLYKPKTNTFEVFTKEKDGLLNDNILAINESESGLLLIGTPTGLSVFDSNKNAFRNFYYTRGFPLIGVNNGSIFISKNKEIYVGGVDAMIIFKEDDLHSSISQPFDVELSNLFVDNREVKLNDNTGILKATLPFTKKIKLKYGYSVFSVEFATNNYVNSHFGDVEYRLKGYDSNWQTAHFGRILTYTSIRPGKYLLELRPKSFPGKTRSLEIQIMPPFYFTWPAYLLYLILFIAVLYWVIRQYKTRLILKTSLAFEQEEKRRSEELIQTKLRFFTNVTHEFLTPITLIMGQAETLLRSYNIHPKVYSKISNIYKSANSLKGLLRELLDFRKQEQGFLELKVEKLDLVDFLRENHLVFKEYASGRKIDLELQSNAEQIYVWADVEQMQKVVSNLLSNALKHTHAGGNIHISIKETRDEVEFAISDTGDGIPPEDLDYIFNRFYQVKTDDISAGTGIGLALTKGIIDAHQGTIEVQSTLEKGSVFTVTLKKGNKHFNEKQLLSDKSCDNIDDKNYLNLDNFLEEIQEVKRNHTEFGEEREEELSRILIVEDNEDLRNMLYEAFNHLYHVEVAVDGLDAWTRINDFNPDIVISDIMMPNMSGVELCSKIKNNVETCHIPVVLLTAKTADEHKFEGLRTGADDYITKPFDIRLLIVRCNNLINNRKLLQQKYINNEEFLNLKIATNPFDEEFLDKATEITLTNLQNDKFDVDAFAQEMNLGRTSFFNKLKAITGLTPNQFIMNIRLKKAADLLTTNLNMNVSDVAYDVGFSSPYYFSKCFKEFYEVSPNAYKKGDRKKS